MEKDKRYGLQLRVKPPQQKKPPPRPPLSTPLAFCDDDDDNVENEISRQAYKKKTHKDVEEQHKKALEEDPSVFDYDGVYDDIKQKSILPRAQDRQERKPKYIQALLEKAKKREREHEIVYEKKLAKERSQEDHLYAGKDKFVTSAYKRKLAEQAKWLEEERLRELREEKDDVTKKSDISDFYFNLSKNVAFGGGASEVRKEPIEDVATKKNKEDVATKKNKEDVATKKNEEDVVTKMHDEDDATRSTENSRLSTYNENSHGVIKSHDKGDSSSLDHKSEEEPVQPVPDAPKQGDEPSPSEQPKQDHHKRKQDALAAAKERFLARKKAKEQMDLERAKEQIGF